MGKIVTGRKGQQFVVGVLTAGLLVGCGGGGGDTGGNTIPTPQSVQCTAVQYVDANVCKNKSAQIIIDFSLPALSVGEKVTLTAKASSGLAVSYSSKTTNICTVTGSEVTAVAKGTCTVAANQAGDGKNLAATEFSAQTLVKPVCSATQYLDTTNNSCLTKSSQSITGFTLAAMSVGEKVTLTAKASSGLPVVYVSNTVEVCSVASNQVSALKAGECSITANQAGDAKTLAAVEVVVKATISVPVTARIKLTKTGITTCGNNTTNGLSCTPEALGALYGLGQDGEVRAGQAMGYTVLNRNGVECIQDNVTGLIWEQKTDDGGLRDKDWGYTWYNPNSATNGGLAGTPNGGTCHNKAGGAQCDTQGYIQVLNAANYCGYSDWRMPSWMELLSIVDHGRDNPSINPVFVNTRGEYFWSASPVAYNHNYAWFVSFASGNNHSYFNRKSTVYQIRAVRAGQ